MLAFDLIAFYTHHWAANFTACALERASEPSIATSPGFGRRWAAVS